jgi:hypothetical protein
VGQRCPILVAGGVVEGVQDAIEVLQSAVATATAATSLCRSSPLRVVSILAPTVAIVMHLMMVMAWIRLLRAVGAGEGAEQTACIGAPVIPLPVPLTRVPFSLFVPRLFLRSEVSLALALPGDGRCGVAVVARPLTR